MKRDCDKCTEMRQLADSAMETLNEIKKRYGLENRHIAKEKNAALREAWHLLSVLSMNMMDDGPTWPRVLEWLKRNESYKPNAK